MRFIAMPFAPLTVRWLIVPRCWRLSGCLIINRWLEVVSGMSPPPSKPPPLPPHRQSLLALNDTHPSQPLPEEVQQKCVELLAELLRAVVLNESRTKGGSHD